MGHTYATGGATAENFIARAEGNARHKMDQGCFECGIEYLHGTIVPMRFKNMGYQARSRAVGSPCSKTYTQYIINHI